MNFFGDGAMETSGEPGEELGGGKFSNLTSNISSAQGLKSFKQIFFQIIMIHD